MVMIWHVVRATERAREPKGIPTTAVVSPAADIPARFSPQPPGQKSSKTKTRAGNLAWHGSVVWLCVGGDAGACRDTHTQSPAGAKPVSDRTRNQRVPARRERREMVNEPSYKLRLSVPSPPLAPLPISPDERAGGSNQTSCLMGCKDGGDGIEHKKAKIPTLGAKYWVVFVMWKSVGGGRRANRAWHGTGSSQGAGILAHHHQNQNHPSMAAVLTPRGGGSGKNEQAGKRAVGKEQ